MSYGKKAFRGCIIHMKISQHYELYIHLQGNLIVVSCFIFNIYIYISEKKLKYEHCRKST